MPADLPISAIALSAIPMRGTGRMHGPDMQGAAEPDRAVPPPHPNPSFQLDPALNIVVLQLHDETGDVVSSFPTRQQLNAYRRGDRTVPDAIGGKPATRSSVDLRQEP